MENVMTERTLVIDDILSAKERIDGKVVRTPIFTNSVIDELTGRQVYFKAENLQVTGSFKSRGALNSVAYYLEEFPDIEKFVATSSGNHGIGVAWASKQYGVPCLVYVPHDTPQAKINKITQYEAEVVVCDEETFEDPYKRRSFFVDFLKGGGLPDTYKYISPCERASVVAGQGTVGLEFIEQVPDLDAVLVACGGGGLLAGTAVSVRTTKPSAKVYAVEPKGKDMEKSLRAGQFLWSEINPRLDTIAEGLRKMKVAKLPFRSLCPLVEKDVFTVDDKQIVDAMKTVFSELKLVIEVSAAVSVAGLLSDKMKTLDPSIKKVGIILCGGNADLDTIPWM